MCPKLCVSQLARLLLPPLCPQLNTSPFFLIPCLPTPIHTRARQTPHTPHHRFSLAWFGSQAQNHTHTHTYPRPTDAPHPTPYILRRVLKPVCDFTYGVFLLLGFFKGRAARLPLSAVDGEGGVDPLTVATLPTPAVSSNRHNCDFFALKYIFALCSPPLPPGSEGNVFCTTIGR